MSTVTDRISIDHRRSSARRMRTQRSRRGLSAVWLIVWLPVLLLVFCFLVNVANLWLARVELESAMEAAALAAVKEWGDAGGGPTAAARQAGVEYAFTNEVRGAAMEIGANLDPMPGPDNPNENLECEADDPLMGPSPTNGNLIFGSIVDDDPMFPATFNAGIQPGCGPATVLLDAAGSGQSSLSAQNSWGINFKAPNIGDPPLPAGLNISQVVIDLLPPGNNDDDGTAEFDLDIFNGGVPPLISALLTGDTQGQYRTFDGDTSISKQDDVFGLNSGVFTTTPMMGDNPLVWSNSQVEFVFDTNNPSQLIINFFDNNGNPGDGEFGFQPGDRFRFGALTDGLRFNGPGAGNKDDDGDAVGAVGVQVTVTFSLFTTPTGPPAMAAFVDTEYADVQANYPPDLAPIEANLPLVIPRTPTNAPDNDGQSAASLSGGPGRPFAVRAQAFKRVPLYCSRMLGFMGLDPPSVYAKATAMYDCTNRSPKLIRVDQFICPGP